MGSCGRMITPQRVLHGGGIWHTCKGPAEGKRVAMGALCCRMPSMCQCNEGLHMKLTAKSPLPCCQASCQPYVRTHLTNAALKPCRCGSGPISKTSHHTGSPAAFLAAAVQSCSLCTCLSIWGVQTLTGAPTGPSAQDFSPG